MKVRIPGPARTVPVAALLCLIAGGAQALESPAIGSKPLVTALLGDGGRGAEPTATRRAPTLALRDPTTAAETTRQRTLHAAALRDDVLGVARLIDRGIAVDATDREGRTPLMFAAAFRSMEAARLLLASGADPNVRDLRFGRTALHLAAAFGDEAMARLLIARGADVRLRARGGETPLHGAALYGHVGMIALLVENGAEPDVADNEAVTALQYATRRNRQQAVALLRALGARPDTLRDAVNAGDTARVIALVGNGVDVDAPGLSGTALHLAAAKGYRGIVGTLIDAGADLEAAGDPAGARPLHMAAIGDHAEVAELLLAQGAAVDSRNLEGRTPLILATLFGRRAAVETLLAHGADPHLVDDTHGRSALDYAERGGNAALVPLLRGGRPDGRLGGGFLRGEDLAAIDRHDAGIVPRH